MSDPKTKRGAGRQMDACIRAYRRDYAAGGAYGFDFRTWAINQPETYQRYMHLLSLRDGLPA